MVETNSPVQTIPNVKCDIRGSRRVRRIYYVTDVLTRNRTANGEWNTVYGTGKYRVEKEVWRTTGETIKRTTRRWRVYVKRIRNNGRHRGNRARKHEIKTYSNGRAAIYRRTTIPANDRYTGSQFKSVRRRFSGFSPSPPSIYIYITNERRTTINRETVTRKYFREIPDVLI